jgi:hypothetical protein
VLRKRRVQICSGSCGCRLQRYIIAARCNILKDNFEEEGFDHGSYSCDSSVNMFLGFYLCEPPIMTCQASENSILF